MIIFENPSGEIVSLDIFHKSLPVKHGLVIGTAGSGKSFTANYLLSNFLMENENNHVVILDVGGSYRKLCGLFGGEYLDIDLSEKYAFNPFPEKSLLFDTKGESDPDILSYLTLLVSRMALDKGEILTYTGQSAIEKAILLTYQGGSNGKAPLLENVREHLGTTGGSDEEARKLASHFARNLELWTSGRYGRLVNREGALDTNARIVVFDLQKLQAHEGLQGVIFFMIQGLLEKKMRDASLRKIIVIDEGWRFFSDEVGSLLIQNLYRTARKHNAAVYSLSQSPKDFLDTPAADAIVTNSYIKLILKLSKGHEILTRFELNEKEIDEVKALSVSPGKFSDIFIKFMNYSTTLRLEPNSLDYWICTTRPEDKEKEDRFLRENPQITSPLEILKGLAKKYPVGGDEKEKKTQ